jgi:hypothetical protein
MPRYPRVDRLVSLRVSRELDRSIAREARRRRRTKSAVLRQILEDAFKTGGEVDPAEEARRQSLRVSGRASERDTLDFIGRVADRRGWR